MMTTATAMRISTILVLSISGSTAAQTVISDFKVPRFDQSLALEESAHTSANVSIGDVDGDGHLDVLLVKGRHWPLQNLLRLGNGKGGFAPAVPVSTGPDRSYSGELVDLDGDGDLDMVVSNDSPDPKRLLHNNGKGSFSEVQQFGTPEWNTRHVSVADLNHDGHPDVVVANRGGRAGTESFVCFGVPGGLLRAPCVPVYHGSATTITPADMDGDGDLDLVIPHRDGGQSEVRLNDGSGAFPDRRIFGPDRAGYRSAAVADFDGDGYADIAIIAPGSRTGIETPGPDGGSGVIAPPQLGVFFGAAHGAFGPLTLLTSSADEPYALLAADVNGDGQMDLTVGHVGARPTVWFNRGGRVFSPVPFGDEEGSVYGFAVADLNGDGVSDIAVARSGATNQIYYGSGQPSTEASFEHEPQPSPAAIITLTEGTNLAVAVNPVNGDKVIALQSTLYLQSANQKSTKALTGWHDDAWEPDFHPNGTRVVYEGYRAGSFDLWSIDPYAQSDPQQLTSSPFDDREPQYSPDGTKIIFSSDRSGSHDIWQLAPGAGDPVQLTFLDAEAHSPAWHPSGDGFAYLVTDRKGSSVYLQASSGEARKLFESQSQLSGLQFLPSANQLSLRTLSRDENGNALSSLSVLDMETQTLRPLTAPEADVFPFRAQWQSDDSALFTADGQVKRLHQSGLMESEPFIVEVPIVRPAYARKTQDFDSTVPRQVLGISYPTLSPDGNVVAFTAIGDLYLWDIAQQQLSQITDDPAADQTPHWSRDGRRLSWISDKGGQYRSWTLDKDSGEVSSLAFAQKFISFPAWSPDGSKLAFFTDVPANPLLHVLGQLVIYDLKTATQSPILAPMPPQPVNWSADGEYLLTTRRQSYNQRFREGLYVLVAAEVKTGKGRAVVPHAHRSITHATLADDNRVAYSQNGVLNLLKLSADMQPLGAPEVIVDSLADMPSFSYSGESLVYLAGRRLMRLNLATGESADVTPPMRWMLDAPDEKWVLRAGKLFDGTSQSYRSNVDILINGQRIEAIAPTDLNTPHPVVDASNQTVIPGLFESHAHIGDHNHSEVQGRTWLAYGITSVRDPGSNPYLANERKEAWGSGRRIGPRTFITGHNMDGNRVYYAVAEGIASDEHLERALQRSRELDVDFIKTYVRMPDRQQQRVVEFAHDIGIPVTSHELLPAAAYGVDFIEHFTGTSRRGYTTKISELGRSYQDVVEVLSGTGMGIVPTMVVPGVVLTFEEQNDLYSTPQFNAFYGPSAKQNYQDFMGFFGPGSEGYVDAYGELLSKLIERGALVGLGTDSPFTPFGTGLHAELRLYQREGLKPYQILQAATLQSARIAGVAQDLGSIEVGKLADMVIIDGDPLADISATTNVTGTLKNGRYYPIETLLNPWHSDRRGAILTDD